MSYNPAAMLRVIGFLIMVSGLMLIAQCIGLSPIIFTVHAAGPVSANTHTNSTIRVNNSGINNADSTATVGEQQKNSSKNNTEIKTAQNTTGYSNMTKAGNITKAVHPSQPLSQRQIPYNIPQYPYQQQQPYPFQPYQQQQPNSTYPCPSVPAPYLNPTSPCRQQPFQQQQPSPYQQPNNNNPFSPYLQQPSYSYPPPIIVSQSAYTDSIGTVHIVGEVINQSPVTARFVEIVATFYNAYNQVVGTDTRPVSRG